MKIVIVAEVDQGGSGYELAKALRCGGADATLIVKKEHKYGYGYDVLLGGSPARVKRGFDLIARGADILHFKGDQLPNTGWLRAFNHSKASKVLTAGGSGFRRNESGDRKSKTELQWFSIDRYRARVDAMSAITPDLMYDEDITLLPHAHQSRPVNRVFRDVPLIGHSPSHRAKKGTDTVFLPAIEILRSRGYAMDLMMIEGVDNSTCVEMKSKCDLFFDQAVCNAYGNSAIEAMMCGVPVITRMSESSISKDDHYASYPGAFFSESCPYQAAEAIARMLDDRDPKNTSRLTIEWASGLHSYESVCERAEALYNRAIVSRLTKPRRTSHRSTARQPDRQRR